MTEQEILKYNYTNGGSNYVLLGNVRWIAFIKNVLEKKLISKYGFNFNLIVYWYENSSKDNIGFICIPYSKISYLFSEELLTDRNTKKARWMVSIKKNMFSIRANTNFSIDITPYLNKIYKDVETCQENMSAEEGQVKYQMHKSIERNSTIVNKLKSKRKQSDPKLHCEICGFSFIEKYGDIGEGFIEAHHKVPLSSLEQSTVTKESDLILICSNCHRMLHRTNPVMSYLELKSKIKS